MAKTANEVLRDFVRFTGDGLPNDPAGHPLPIGDPSSGVHNPTKKDFRDLLNTIAAFAADSSTIAGALSAKADLLDLRNGRVFGSGVVTPTGATIPDGVNRVIAQAGGGQQIWGRTTAPADNKETATIKRDAGGIWWQQLWDSLSPSPALSGVLDRASTLERQAVPAWWSEAAAVAALSARANFPTSFIVISAAGLKWYERGGPITKGKIEIIGTYGNATYGLRGELPFDLDDSLAATNDQLSSLQSTVGAEEASRAAADSDLQRQIDALTVGGGTMVTATSEAGGLAATVDGQFFMVISASSAGFFRNDAGTASPLYQFVSASALDARPATFEDRADAQAASIAPPANSITVAHAGRALSYADAGAFAAPALITNGGRRWNPAEEWTVSHFGAVGDGAADDTAALTLARDAMRERGGGVLILPRGRFKMAAGLLWDFNNFKLRGEGETATIIDLSGAGRFSVGKCFDFGLAGFSVLNSTDGIVIGEDEGAQQYAASFTVERIATNFSGGRGFAVGMAYMADLANIRAQGAAGIGMDFSTGLKTSISVRNSHALDCGSDGWKIKNANYCDFTTCGADRNAGYGYHLENLNGVTLQGGAEDNAKAALHLHHDLATADVTKKFTGVRVSMFEKNNNPSAGPGGQFAHFTCSAASADAGTVEFEGCSNFVPPVGTNVVIDAGKYHIIWPRGNSLTRAVSGGAYSVVTDGATGRRMPNPVTVTAADTTVAALKPALANGVMSYGGELLIYATRNPLSQAAKSATYKLLLSRAAGDSGIVAVTPVGQDGRTTGRRRTRPASPFGTTARTVCCSPAQSG